MSVSSTGRQGNGESDQPSISADGRFVAFASNASNLVPNDTNDTTDIFVRDLRLGTTRLVSASPVAPVGIIPSFDPSISASGRLVAFDSWNPNLVPNDTNDTTDVFVRDLRVGTTQLVSVSTTGTSGDGFSNIPSISADGRRIAFASAASNLVPNVSGGVFVRDLRRGTTQAVSGADYPSISADGRYLAFVSLANGNPDVYVRDLRRGTTRLASVSTTGGGGNNWSSRPSISAHGRFVAFESAAWNLVSNDTNGVEDVFARGALHRA